MKITNMTIKIVVIYILLKLTKYPSIGFLPSQAPLFLSRIQPDVKNCRGHNRKSLNFIWPWSFDFFSPK